MIRTTPFRRMILHRSQRGLIDARTFMTPSPEKTRPGLPCRGLRHRPRLYLLLSLYVADAATVSIVLVIRPLMVSSVSSA